MDHVTRATPLSVMVGRVVGRPTLDMACCKHTKFDKAIALAVPEIFQGYMQF